MTTVYQTSKWKKLSDLTEQDKQEIAQLYADKKIRAAHIAETYNIPSAQLYRLIHDMKLQLRDPKLSMATSNAAKRKKDPEHTDGKVIVRKAEELSAPKPAAAIPHPEPSGLYLWEVTVVVCRKVRGDSIEHAIKAARDYYGVTDVTSIRRLEEMP